MRSIIIASAALAALSAPCSATIVYQNNFDNENGGQPANDYTGFNGLVVPFAADGDSVDLIADGDAGRRCAGGSGLCVDLDGNQSSLIGTLAPIAFNAGDIVTWTFDISGSQRPESALDVAVFRFRFLEPNSGTYTFTNSLGANESGGFDTGGRFATVVRGSAYDVGFQSVRFSFQADNAGVFRVSIDDFTPDYGDDDDDGYGRIIDNFVIDVSPAPEPATWGMMILGFGLVGAAARRRQGLPVPA